MNSAPPTTAGWSEAWLDALAFALGLALAWWFQWNTTDLVWSLWLSSLVVGSALIVRNVSAPLRELLGNRHADRSGIAGPAPTAAVIALYGAGTLLGLGFFTLHFGGFHYAHSIFLSMHFPPGGESMKRWPGAGVYQEVFARYWWFVPSAFLASAPRSAGRCGIRMGR